MTAAQCNLDRLISSLSYVSGDYRNQSEFKKFKDALITAHGGWCNPMPGGMPCK